VAGASSVDGVTRAFLVDGAAQEERRLWAAGVPIAEPLGEMHWAGNGASI